MLVKPVDYFCFDHLALNALVHSTNELAIIMDPQLEALSTHVRTAMQLYGVREQIMSRKILLRTSITKFTY